MRTSTRALVLLALVATLVTFLSFLKFNHCATNGWGQPDTNIHACYTDISALFYERDLDKDKWPFSGAVERTVEYPVLQAVVMWGAATVVGSDVIDYYYLSIALIAALFILSVFLVRTIAPRNVYLYAIAPTGVAALFINWDLWAIVPMLIAIYLFDKGKYLSSAATLGISIATKFFPIALLLPVVIFFARKKQYKNALTYTTSSLGVYGLINLPFAIAHPEGWWRFFDLNIHRDPDWGSLWLAISNLGFTLPQFNLLTTLSLLIALLAITFLLFSTQETLTLAESAIFPVAVLMSLGKVYSPQYVLWLAPLVVIAISSKESQLRKVLPIFWMWQFTEIMYHVAIWIYLAGYGSEKALIPEHFYTISILLRLAGMVAILAALLRQHRMSGQFPREFLFESGGVYP